MTCEQQSTLEASGIEWPALKNHLPSMAHAIQLGFGAFICRFSFKGYTKSLDTHQRDQQFGENEWMDIAKSQWLRKQGNARNNKVSALRPGLTKIIEHVCISRYFESPETELHIAQNTCYINYADTWSSKRVHWLSTSGTTYHGCEYTSVCDTRVASGSLPIARNHLWVPPESTIQSIPATLHNTESMDHHQVGDGSCEAIPILDPVDVKMTYCHIASWYHSPESHVQSYRWSYASFSKEADSIQGRFVLQCEVSTTEAVQILCWNYSNDGCASHFSTYPWSFPQAAIVQEVGQWNGYQSCGRDFVCYPIPRGISEVCGEWILCETRMCASDQTRKRTDQQSFPLCNSYRIRSMFHWSIWLVQRSWTILDVRQCGWNDTRTKLLHSTLFDCCQAPFRFHCLDHQTIGGKLFPISMITTPTQMQISSTCSIPDNTDWWQHQEETHSTYANLSHLSRDIFLVIPHGVGV